MMTTKDIGSLEAEAAGLRVFLAEARKTTAQLQRSLGRALVERDDARAAVRALHAIDGDVTRTPPAVVAACERLATMQTRVQVLEAEALVLRGERDSLCARVAELESDLSRKESARRALHEDRHALCVEIVKARVQLRGVLTALSSGVCPRAGHEDVTGGGIDG